MVRIGSVGVNVGKKCFDAVPVGHPLGGSCLDAAFPTGATRERERQQRTGEMEDATSSQFLLENTFYSRVTDLLRKYQTNLATFRFGQEGKKVLKFRPSGVVSSLLINYLSIVNAPEKWEKFKNTL